MAPRYRYFNNARTTLAGGISASDTTVQVASGSSGAIFQPFPLPSGGDFIVATFTDAATQSLIEIIHITNVNTGSDVLTITRAQEGTSAQNWGANDILSVRPTADTMGYLLQIDGGSYVGASISHQQEYVSAARSMGNNTTGPPFIYTTMQTVSFQFPPISPTGKFALFVQSILNGGANLPLTGVAANFFPNFGSTTPPSGWTGGGQQGQIISSVRDMSAGVELIATEGHQYVAFSQGGSFGFSSAAIAGINPGIGSADRTRLYLPNQIVSIAQRAALANTGTFTIDSGVTLGGILILTALPA